MPHNLVPTRQRGNAKSMRKAMTEAELKLWNAVRAHRLMGLGFRRQLAIDRYIVDFACPQMRIVVEVDGSQHNDPDALLYDLTRTAFLEKSGWTVLRFTNDDVLKDIEGVCQHILITTKERSPA
ncbi:MAG: endonuclease domain-containing protein [Rhizobiaceae bacterium]